MLFIFLYFLIFILLSMAIMFFIEKDFFIKLLYVNYINNIILLFIATLGTFENNESFLDIVLIYILFSFVGNKAILKYFYKL
jgi:hypothetical protein